MREVRNPINFTRVRAALPHWLRLGAPPKVVALIIRGYTVRWVQNPPPPFDMGISAIPLKLEQWFQLESAKNLKNGSWSRVSSLTHTSRAFVVENAAKPRLVIDLRRINSFCRKEEAKFESLTVLRRMLRKNDWLWSLDLKAAYTHFAILKAQRHFFGFAVRASGVVHKFVCNTLPFGFVNSPALFIQCMLPILKVIRAPCKGVPTRCFMWLDDWAFIHEEELTLEEVLSRRNFILNMFAALGLDIAWEKGQLFPSKVLLAHLGYCIDSARAMFLLTAKRTKQLQGGAAALLKQAANAKGWVMKRSLASFVGLANSSSLAVRATQLHLRHLHDVGMQSKVWSNAVKLTSAARTELRFWLNITNQPEVGRAYLSNPASIELWCDASSHGWGAALHPRLRITPASGVWSEKEFPQFIAWKELKAVTLAIRHFLPLLVQRTVLLHEDNQCVVAALSKLVSRSPPLMAELRVLWDILLRNEIKVIPQYIESKKNEVADRLSRLCVPREYGVKREHFQHIENIWGPCTVDAFASPVSAQLPRFWTPRSHAGGEARDAFAQEWAHEKLWVHPPPFLLDEVVAMLQASGAEAVVLAPTWRAAPWYGMLMGLARDVHHLPRGALRKVAADAPPNVEHWLCTAFFIPRRPRPQP